MRSSACVSHNQMFKGYQQLARLSSRHAQPRPPASYTALCMLLRAHVCAHVHSPSPLLLIACLLGLPLLLTAEVVKYTAVQLKECSSTQQYSHRIARKSDNEPNASGLAGPGCHTTSSMELS